MATNNSVNGWKQSVGSGNPNGSVAGSIGDQYFDKSAFILYQCSVSGTTSTAVWIAQGAGSSNSTIYVNATTTTSNAYAGSYANGTAGVGATFTFTATGAQTCDSSAIVLNGIYHLKNQANPIQNGVYLCTTFPTTGVQGVLTRATNYNTSALINSNIFIKPIGGSLNLSSAFYVLSGGTFTIGSTAITYEAMVNVGGISPNWPANQLLISGSGGFGFCQTTTTAPTGLTIPKPLISGQTTATTVAAGNIGEFISSVIPFASSVNAVTTNVPFNVTSISLTAGDWDVWGNAYFNTLNGTQLYSWISLTTAAQPDQSLLALIFNVLGGNVVPSLRVNISSTTTVFLSANIVFVSGTAQACGGIYARRRD